MTAINHEKPLKWFESGCDWCRKVTLVAIGELSGDCLCEECYDQREGEVAVDIECGDI